MPKDLSTNTWRRHQKWNTSHRAQLATSRGPWKSIRTDTFLLSQVGQEKEEAKGRGEEVGWGLQPGGTWKGRAVSTSREGPRWGPQFGQKESLILCGREHDNPRVAAGQGETCTRGPDPCPTHPAWEARPPLQTGAGCWNVGFRAQTQAEDCGWQWGDTLRAQKWGRGSVNGMLVEEAWTTTEQSTNVWTNLTHQGAGTRGMTD